MDLDLYDNTIKCSIIKNVSLFVSFNDEETDIKIFLISNKEYLLDNSLVFKEFWDFKTFKKEIYEFILWKNKDFIEKMFYLYVVSTI